MASKQNTTNAMTEARNCLVRAVEQAKTTLDMSEETRAYQEAIQALERFDAAFETREVVASPTASTVRKTVTDATKNKGGRPKGLAPTMVDKIVDVMGDREMTAGDVYALLESRGMLPSANTKPNGISIVFSSNKSTFQNVSRGVWRVVKASSPVSVATTDEVLADLGITENGAAPNPFGANTVSA